VAETTGSIKKLPFIESKSGKPPQMIVTDEKIESPYVYLSEQSQGDLFR